MNLEEIRAWNKRLKDAFPGISFQEDIHKYTIAGQEDRPIKSVSALMKYFYEEFDSDTLAEKYAKSRKLDPEDVKLAWAGEGTISTTHGTKVHLFGEDYIKWKWLGELDEPPVVFDKQSLGVKQFLDSLPSYFVPVASELQMYHPEHWYCGTADIIFYNEKTGKLSIGDFKGLEINTPILTTEGFKKMGDIEVGDMVYDPNGFPTRVKNTSKIKKKKSYKIKFDDNSEIIADFEHRWKVFRLINQMEIESVETTEEIYEKIKTFTKGNRKSEHIVKVRKAKPLSNTQKFQHPENMDFWLLGLWFADGNRHYPTISKGDERIWEEVERRGFRLSINHSRKYDRRCRSHTVYGLSDMLKHFSLVKNKHLPDKLLTHTTFEERLELLQGFMDGDGHYNKARNRYVVSTTQLWMVDFSLKLLNSLGVKATLLKANMFYKGQPLVKYDICFSTDEFSPFLVRVADNKPLQKPTSSFLRINSIEPVGECLTKCIEVESDTHMFLCGKELIPTHNTNRVIEGDKYSEKPLKYIGEKYGLDSSNLSKYSVQFSFYQLMLQNKGFEFDTRVLIHLTDDKFEKKLYKTYRTLDLTEDLDNWLLTKEHLK